MKFILAMLFLLVPRRRVPSITKTEYDRTHIAKCSLCGEAAKEDDGFCEECHVCRKCMAKLLW